MATVTKSIGVGKDYTTITLWAADLSNFPGDDCIGELYDEIYAESPTISVGVNSVTLTVAAGNRHDGTAGSGARIDGNLEFRYPTGGNSIYEWFELYRGPSTYQASLAIKLGNQGIVRNLLVHDISSYQSLDAIQCRYYGQQVLNCIIYGIHQTTSSANRAYAITQIYASGSSGMTCANNTIWNVTTAGSGAAHGIYGWTTYEVIKNNISMGVSAPSGTAGDFEGAGTAWGAGVDNNMSEDATAPGSTVQINKTVADQFVSTVSGSEDLHLKPGSDAIGNGVDLVTTPAGVQFDIDGRDRDTLGDTWSIGADQFVAPAPTVTAISPSSGPTVAGRAVTITGTDFTGATSVTIGGTAATSVVVVGATSITAVTPAGSLGAQDVVVTTGSGPGTLSSGYTYAAGKFAEGTSAANWNTAGTWLPSGVPSASDDVTVDAGSPDIAIDTAAACASLTSTGYTNTLTQNAGQTLTVSGDIAWSGGTFMGGDSAVTAKTFALTGGTWTCTSDTFSIENYTTNIVGALFIYSGGTFTHGGGTSTVRFAGGDSLINLDCTSTPVFNNLAFEGGHIYRTKWTLSGSATVAGNLSINPSPGVYLLLNGGTYNVGGNISSVDGASGGTSVIALAGTHTYSGTAAGRLPKLQILAGASVTAASPDASCQYFEQTGGSFTCPTGTFSIENYTTNIVGALFIYSGGTFTHGGGTSTVRFAGGDSLINLDCTSTPVFNNLAFEGGHIYRTKWTLSGSATVAGNLSINPSPGVYLLLNGGTYNVGGNISSVDGASGGTSAITLNGTGDQTITQTAGLLPNTLKNSNTTGIVLQATDMVNPAQTLTIDNGAQWCMEGYALGTSSVINNGILYRHGTGLLDPLPSSNPALDESHIAGGTGPALLSRAATITMARQNSSKRSIGRSGNVLLRRRHRRLLG